MFIRQSVSIIDLVIKDLIHSDPLLQARAK